MPEAQAGLADVGRLQLGPVGADPDGRVRPLQRRGVEAQVVVVEELAVVGEDLTGPGLLHHFDGLVEASAPGLLVDVEALELLRPVARRESEQEPAVREHVERRLVLGIAQRVVQAEQRAAGADADARGAARDRGQHGQQVGTIAVVPEVMLGQPEAVEADLFGEEHVLHDLVVEPGPRARMHAGALHPVKAQPEFHGDPERSFDQMPHRLQRSTGARTESIAGWEDTAARASDRVAKTLSSLLNPLVVPT